MELGCMREGKRRGQRWGRGGRTDEGEVWCVGRDWVSQIRIEKEGRERGVGTGVGMANGG